LGYENFGDFRLGWVRLFELCLGLYVLYLIDGDLVRQNYWSSDPRPIRNVPGEVDHQNAADLAEGPSLDGFGATCKRITMSNKVK